jgi:hypothetical protein
MANCGELKTDATIYSIFSLSLSPPFFSLLIKSLSYLIVRCVFCFRFVFFLFLQENVQISRFVRHYPTCCYFNDFCFSSRSDLGGDIHEDNPSEELNLFLPENSNKHYGYPYCWSEGLLNHPQAGGPGIHQNSTHTHTHTLFQFVSFELKEKTFCFFHSGTQWAHPYFMNDGIHKYNIFSTSCLFLIVTSLLRKFILRITSNMCFFLVIRGVGRM